MYLVEIYIYLFTLCVYYLVGLCTSIGIFYVQCAVCISPGWNMYIYRTCLCIVYSLFITWLEYVHLQDMFMYSVQSVYHLVGICTSTGPVYVQCTFCTLPGWNMYIYRFLVKIKLFFFFWWINKTTKINIIKLFCRLKYSASLPVTAKKVLLKKFSEIKF